MRMGMTAALLLMETAAASATSLTGKPFVIDATTQAEQVFASLYDTKAGAFGVLLTQDTSGDKVTDAASLLEFSAAGKQVGKKALVRPADGKGATAGLLPGGALPLADGRALTAVSLSAYSQTGPAGFLDGQFMANGKRDGAAFPLDTATKGDFYFGYLRELQGGRGLASWTTATGFGAPQITTARFVSTKGTLGKTTVDLSRPNAMFAGAEPYLTGFIVQHVQANASYTNATVWARIYDSKGADTGKEMKLADRKPYMDAVFTSALGLADGSILVMRSAKVGNGATLYARRYDGAWKPLGAEKTLATGLKEQIYVAQPLPGGDLLIGVKVADGASAVALEFKRFKPTLAPVGAAARISGVAKPDFVHLLALENGNAVVAYTSNEKKLTGQLIKP